MTSQRISPSVLPQLREALTLAFWYKKDLRMHLSASMPGNELVSQLQWADDYKRNLINRLVNTMAADQDKYFDDLLSLILSTAEITDPSHLRSVEDGAEKYERAVAALESLRKQVEPYRRLRDDADEVERRRAIERAKTAAMIAINQKIEAMKAEFYDMVKLGEQARGYALEKFLNKLFEIFDLDSKGPFRISGAQIDGAFTLDSTEFLVEAKWQADRTPIADLVIFAGKIRKKLDNTLGLFLSMNGFQDTAVAEGADGRPVMVLMDGADLSAVLENRIQLPDLLRRKRQHAAQTGETFLSAYAILG